MSVNTEWSSARAEGPPEETLSPPGSAMSSAWWRGGLWINVLFLLAATFCMTRIGAGHHQGGMVLAMAAILGLAFMWANRRERMLGAHLNDGACRRCPQKPGAPDKPRRDR